LRLELPSFIPILKAVLETPFPEIVYAQPTRYIFPNLLRKTAV